MIKNKRFLKTAIVFLLVMFPFITVAAAESEWLIDSIEKLEKWTSDSRMLQYEIKNGKCEFTVMGDAPYISYNVPGGKETDFSKYKIAAFRVNCDTEGCSVKVVAENISGEKFECTTALNCDGEWHDYIIDFSAKGKISSVKVCFVSETYADSSARIVFERIGFFEDAEKARYFLDRTLVSLKEKEELLYPSGNGPFKWNFSETSDISLWNISADYMQELGMLSLEPKDGNPITIGKTFDDNYFNSKEYHFFAVRYKSSASYNVARIDFKTNKYGNASEFFVLKNDGMWHNLVIDMSKYSDRKWNGYVTEFALVLPYKDIASGDTVCIERAGFFDNYNDASLYLVESANREDFTVGKVLKGDNYKIIVPNGAMTERYAESDICPEFPKEIKPTGVVMLDGNPLPLSDVSKNGYIVYCAKQKGAYTVGSYIKEYTDTQTHWAREYIDYVSSRTLFSGTSPNTFSPNMTITRGMFVTVLGRMHGVNVDDGVTDSGYIDVSSEEYYAPYIEWVKESGIFVVSGDRFYPDHPISRSEMALVIANYTDFCGFEIQRYETSNNFEDISGCAEEVKKAIEKIQSIGIITGKSNTVFDPNGILTRAEASAVMTRLIKSVLGVFYGSTVRENGGIRIGAYANLDTDVLNESLLYAYFSAGFDSMLVSNEIAYSDKREFVLGYCDRHGIDAIMPLDITSAQTSELAEYYGHPSFCGSFISDEPGMNEFEVLSEYSKKSNGEKKFVVNLLPLYSSEAQLEYGKLASYPEYYDTPAEKYRNYCEEYVRNVATDVVMTSVFPFIGDGIYERYIEAVSIPADVANQNGKEFWCIVQADNVHSDKSHFIRQYYTLLSFGCKNIILWLWNDGLCDDFGGYTDSYNSVKEVNKAFKPVNEILSEYTYSHTSVFNAVFDENVHGIREIPSGFEIKNTGAPVIIGAFEKEQEKAYMLCNASAAQSAEIVVDITGRHNSVAVHGEMGATKVIKGKNVLTVTLGAGEGVLITF